MGNFTETFNLITTNAAQLDATKYFVVEDVVNAEKNNNLPHNACVIANAQGQATLFVFLDQFSDQDKPDFVILPNQTMAIDHREGFHWTTMFIKNTHATEDISADAIKIRIATVKEKEGVE